jgi:hypothetical protein
MQLQLANNEPLNVKGESLEDICVKPFNRCPCPNHLKK